MSDEHEPESVIDPWNNDNQHTDEDPKHSSKDGNVSIKQCIRSGGPDKNISERRWAARGFRSLCKEMSTLDEIMNWHKNYPLHIIRQLLLSNDQELMVVSTEVLLIISSYKQYIQPLLSQDFIDLVWQIVVDLNNQIQQSNEQTRMNNNNNNNKNNTFVKSPKQDFLDQYQSLFFDFFANMAIDSATHQTFVRLSEYMIPYISRINQQSHDSSSEHSRHSAILRWFYNMTLNILTIDLLCTDISNGKRVDIKQMNDVCVILLNLLSQLLNHNVSHHQSGNKEETLLYCIKCIKNLMVINHRNQSEMIYHFINNGLVQLTHKLFTYITTLGTAVSHVNNINNVDLSSYQSRNNNESLDIRNFEYPICIELSNVFYAISKYNEYHSAILLKLKINSMLISLAEKYIECRVCIIKIWLNICCNESLQSGGKNLNENYYLFRNIINSLKNILLTESVNNLQILNLVCQSFAVLSYNSSNIPQILSSSNIHSQNESTIHSDNENSNVIMRRLLDLFDCCSLPISIFFSVMSKQQSLIAEYFQSDKQLIIQIMTILVRSYQSLNNNINSGDDNTNDQRKEEEKEEKQRNHRHKMMKTVQSCALTLSNLSSMNEECRKIIFNEFKIRSQGLIEILLSEDHSIQQCISSMLCNLCSNDTTHQNQARLNHEFIRLLLNSDGLLKVFKQRLIGDHMSSDSQSIFNVLAILNQLTDHCFQSAQHSDNNNNNNNNNHHESSNQLYRISVFFAESILDCANIWSEQLFISYQVCSLLSQWSTSKEFRDSFEECKERMMQLFEHLIHTLTVRRETQISEDHASSIILHLISTLSNFRNDTRVVQILVDSAQQSSSSILSCLVSSFIRQPSILHSGCKQKLLELFAGITAANEHTAQVCIDIGLLRMISSTAKSSNHSFRVQSLAIFGNLVGMTEITSDQSPTINFGVELEVSSLFLDLCNNDGCDSTKLSSALHALANASRLPEFEHHIGSRLSLLSKSVRECSSAISSQKARSLSALFFCNCAARLTTHSVWSNSDLIRYILSLAIDIQVKSVSNDTIETVSLAWQCVSNLCANSAHIPSLIQCGLFPTLRRIGHLRSNIQGRQLSELCDTQLSIILRILCQNRMSANIIIGDHCKLISDLLVPLIATAKMRSSKMSTDITLNGCVSLLHLLNDYKDDSDLITQLIDFETIDSLIYCAIQSDQNEQIIQSISSILVLMLTSIAVKLSDRQINIVFATVIRLLKSDNNTNDKNNDSLIQCGLQVLISRHSQISQLLSQGSFMDILHRLGKLNHQSFGRKVVKLLGFLSAHNYHKLNIEIIQTCSMIIRRTIEISCDINDNTINNNDDDNELKHCCSVLIRNLGQSHANELYSNVIRNIHNEHDSGSSKPLSSWIISFLNTDQITIQTSVVNALSQLSLNEEFSRLTLKEASIPARIILLGSRSIQFIQNNHREHLYQSNDNEIDKYNELISSLLLLFHNLSVISSNMDLLFQRNIPLSILQWLRMIWPILDNNQQIKKTVNHNNHDDFMDGRIQSMMLSLDASMKCLLNITQHRPTLLADILMSHAENLSVLIIAAGIICDHWECALLTNGQSLGQNQDHQEMVVNLLCDIFSLLWQLSLVRTTEADINFLIEQVSQVLPSFCKTIKLISMVQVMILENNNSKNNNKNHVRLSLTFTRLFNALLTDESILSYCLSDDHIHLCLQTLFMILKNMEQECCASITNDIRNVFECIMAIFTKLLLSSRISNCFSSLIDFYFNENEQESIDGLTQLSDCIQCIQNKNNNDNNDSHPFIMSDQLILTLQGILRVLLKFLEHGLIELMNEHENENMNEDEQQSPHQYTLTMLNHFFWQNDDDDQPRSDHHYQKNGVTLIKGLIKCLKDNSISDDMTNPSKISRKPWLILIQMTSRLMSIMTWINPHCLIDQSCQNILSELWNLIESDHYYSNITPPLSCLEQTLLYDCRMCCLCCITHSVCCVPGISLQSISFIPSAILSQIKANRYELEENSSSSHHRNHSDLLLPLCVLALSGSFSDNPAVSVQSSAVLPSLFHSHSLTELLQCFNRQLSDIKKDNFKSDEYQRVLSEALLQMSMVQTTEHMEKMLTEVVLPKHHQISVMLNSSKMTSMMHVIVFTLERSISDHRNSQVFSSSLKSSSLLLQCIQALINHWSFKIDLMSDDLIDKLVFVLQSVATMALSNPCLISLSSVLSETLYVLSCHPSLGHKIAQSVILIRFLECSLHSNDRRDQSQHDSINSTLSSQTSRYFATASICQLSSDYRNCSSLIQGNVLGCIISDLCRIVIPPDSSVDVSKNPHWMNELIWKLKTLCNLNTTPLCNEQFRQKRNNISENNITLTNVLKMRENMIELVLLMEEQQQLNDHWRAVIEMIFAVLLARTMFHQSDSINHNNHNTIMIQNNKDNMFSEHKMKLSKQMNQCLLSWIKPMMIENHDYITQVCLMYSLNQLIHLGNIYDTSFIDKLFHPSLDSSCEWNWSYSMLIFINSYDQCFMPCSINALGCIAQNITNSAISWSAMMSKDMSQLISEMQLNPSLWECRTMIRSISAHLKSFSSIQLNAANKLSALKHSDYDEGMKHIGIMDDLCDLIAVFLGSQDITDEEMIMDEHVEFSSLIANPLIRGSFMDRLLNKSDLQMAGDLIANLLKAASENKQHSCFGTAMLILDEMDAAVAASASAASDQESTQLFMIELLKRNKYEIIHRMIQVIQSLNQSDSINDDDHHYYDLITSLKLFSGFLSYDEDICVEFVECGGINIVHQCCLDQHNHSINDDDSKGKNKGLISEMSEYILQMIAMIFRWDLDSILETEQRQKMIDIIFHVSLEYDQSIAVLHCALRSSVTFKHLLSELHNSGYVRRMVTLGMISLHSEHLRDLAFGCILSLLQCSDAQSIFLVNCNGQQLIRRLLNSHIQWAINVAISIFEILSLNLSVHSQMAKQRLISVAFELRNQTKNAKKRKQCTESIVRIICNPDTHPWLRDDSDNIRKIQALIKSAPSATVSSEMRVALITALQSF